jgi:hypothetical protein
MSFSASSTLPSTAVMSASSISTASCAGNNFFASSTQRRMRSWSSDDGGTPVCALIWDKIVTVLSMATMRAALPSAEPFSSFPAAANAASMSFIARSMASGRKLPLSLRAIHRLVRWMCTHASRTVGFIPPLLVLLAPAPPPPPALAVASLSACLASLVTAS